MLCAAYDAIKDGRGFIQATQETFCDRISYVKLDNKGLGYLWSGSNASWPANQSFEVFCMYIWDESWYPKS